MDRKAFYISGFILFIFTIVLYWPTWSYGLINLDDYQYVYGKNGVLTNGFSLPGLISSFDSLENAIWMPLTWMSYMADFEFFGASPGWMHFHNSILHAIDAVLVFVLLGMLGKKKSWIVLALSVAIWAWHPLRVEPVVWVSSRKDVLSLFFELLALIAWMKRLNYQEKSRQAQDLRWLSITAFVLACMAKPMAMTFPLLALLLEYNHAGKVRKHDYAVPGSIALCVFYLASVAQRAGGATIVLQGVPFHGRLLNAMAAFGIYCWKTIHPVDLAISCRNYWPELPRFWWQGILFCMGYGAILLITGWLTFFHKTKTFNLKSRTTFCALAFFLVSVGPTLGLSNFGHHSYADRFTYLPAIGFSILLVGIWDAISIKRWLAGALGLGCMLVLGVMLMLSHRQIDLWKDGLSLFKETLRVDGDKNIIALRSVGIYHYDNTHDLKKALFYLDRAFKVNRKANETYHIIYIMLLAEDGRINEAKQELEFYESVDRTKLFSAQNGERPGGAVLNIDLSKFLAQAAINLAEGNIELARQYAERVVELKPDDTWANYLLGKMALAEGDKASAVKFWKQSMSDKRQIVCHRFLAAEVKRLEQL